MSVLKTTCVFTNKSDQWTSKAAFECAQDNQKSSHERNAREQHKKSNHLQTRAEP